MFSGSITTCSDWSISYLSLPFLKGLMLWWDLLVIQIDCVTFISMGERNIYNDFGEREGLVTMLFTMFVWVGFSHFMWDMGEES